MIQITYQKKDGDIMKKLRKTMIPYKIGDTTSMGWKVLNIEYEFDNNYYPESKYNLLVEKSKQSSIKKQQKKELIRREFKTFLYYFIVFVIIKMLLGT